DIRLRVVKQLHRVPLQDWEHYGVTEIVSANTRVSTSIRHFMGVFFVTIFPGIFKLSAFFVALVYVYPYTWYFPLLVLLTYGYVYVGMRHFLQSRRHLWESTDLVRTAMDDSLHNTRFSRFHLEKEASRLGQYFNAEAQGWLRNNFHQHKIPLVQAGMFTMAMGILVVHLVLRLRAGELTVPDFVVIKGYVFAIYGQMDKVTGRLRGLLGSVIDLKKVLDLLALPLPTTDKALPAAPMTLDTTMPVFQLQDVSFTHKNGLQVLKGFSLDIHAGDQVAIIGDSGAGKSTLCHLLAGIYAPQQGKVLLYGTPLQQLPLTTIGQYVHFVNQEANLIGGTIADNLMTDVPSMKKGPLAHLKDRLQNSVGDGGKRLSSGEKQRILLARCLSYQPKVLILDETLSALDEAGAQDLLQSVLAAVPTVILVTHRLSLVQGMKQVYRLEGGRCQRV
ncbi:MAG: ABC transporter ATP-binding protein, partial [Bacteroidota bacterium]